MRAVRWRARVWVTLRAGVLDPQGAATRSALVSLGFTGVQTVRAGKFLELELVAASREEADRQVADMCRRLLANPVTEDFRYELEGCQEG
ncbi:MAG: phosphoribosylformylglycinamidine synthase subunit PurS [bacterium]|nr:phosphoribosylformylglycinamidine synthase subunit PurS [bacterium]